MIKLVCSSHYNKTRRVNSEMEVIKTFKSQKMSRPTTEAFLAIRYHNDGSPPLPGGVPVVDHVAAYIKTSPGWRELQLHIEELRLTRLPTTDDAIYTREFTLGVSTKEEWDIVIKLIRDTAPNLKKNLYPFWAADVEYIPILNTEFKDPYRDSLTLLANKIGFATMSGDKFIELELATTGQRAIQMPVRFFFGNHKFQIHFRLPITYCCNSTVVVLDLSTKLISEARQVYKELPSMVGIGITDDYINWARIVHAIWADASVEKIAKPIELENIMRVARINTRSSSLFHVNWWCLGTILPKQYGSLGDKKWAHKLKDIPIPLRQYLVGDISQVVKVTSLLTIVWSIQSFPDMTVVKAASTLTAITFTLWIQDKIFSKLFSGWCTILTDHNGRWHKVGSKTNWEEQETLEGMMVRLNPPTYNSIPDIWNFPAWPAITAGGPRFLHEVRDAFVTRLNMLRQLDEDTWPLHHEDKKNFWKFGLIRDVASFHSTAPVFAPGLHARPGLKSKVSDNPTLWTKSYFSKFSIKYVRGARVLILEYLRLNPHKIEEVMLYVVSHKEQFTYLVGSKKKFTIVNDMQLLLEQLDITIPRALN